MPSDKCSRLSHSYSSGNPAQEATEKKKKKPCVGHQSIFILHGLPPLLSTRENFNQTGVQEDARNV